MTIEAALTEVSAVGGKVGVVDGVPVLYLPHERDVSGEAKAALRADPARLARRITSGRYAVLVVESALAGEPVWITNDLEALRQAVSVVTHGCGSVDASGRWVQPCAAPQLRHNFARASPRRVLRAVIAPLV